MRRILLITLLLVLAWGAGLVLFIINIPTSPSGDIRAADGVVVYTGGSNRLPSGLALLEKGVGKRLLISGVYQATSREQLAEMWTGAPEGFDCCVDLGRAAQSTRGNAAELKNWASNHGFKKIILVTSDFHMPRAIVETRRLSPGLEIVAYPASSGILNDDGKPRDLAAWKVLAAEYTKYLAARVVAIFR